MVLSVGVHEFGEDFAAGANTIFGKRCKRFVDQVEAAGEVELFGVDVEDAGEDIALFVGFHEHVDGARLAGGCVVFMDLAEAEVRAVVQLNVDGGVVIVVDVDIFELRDEAGFVD